MIVLALGLSAILTAPRCEPFPPGVEAALARVVAEARSVGPGTGLSVAVLHRDRLWLHAMGAASLSPYRPATVDTAFRVGSITKTFTAVAAMRLWEQGQLDLDADVSGQVEEWPAHSGPVTARELLAHTSGVGHYRNVRDGRTLRPYGTTESLQLFKDRPLRFSPGSSFLYSSYGYVLLGVLVERVAGEGFAEHLERTLLGPLELTRTGLESSPKVIADQARGYRLARGAVVPAAPLDISSRFSSGGFRSTAHDVIRWGQALLDGEVLRAETFRMMTRPSVTTEGFSPDYGLGFAVYPLRGRKVVAHAGGQPGASALLFTIPEERFAVALLSNLSGDAPALTQLATALMEVVVDGGAVRRPVYAEEPADEVRVDVFNRVMSHGLVAFREGGEVAGLEPRAAFARLEALLDDARLAATPRDSQDTLRRAYHPRNGRLTVVVGREMARVIAAAHGPGALGSFPRVGPVPFFSAYLAACEVAGCPHPLGPALSGHVRRLATMLDSVPPGLHALRPEELAELADLPAALRPLKGLPVHPSFVEDLTRHATRQRLRGQPDAATMTLELSRLLHPAAPLAHLALAEDAAIRGEPERATAALAAAFAQERSGLSLTPEVLRTRAERLRVGLPAAAGARLDGLYQEARAAARRVALVARSRVDEDPLTAPGNGVSPFDLSAPMTTSGQQ